MSIRSFPKLTAIAKIETEKEKEERQIERYKYSERKRPYCKEAIMKCSLNQKMGVSYNSKESDRKREIIETDAWAVIIRKQRVRLRKRRSRKKEIIKKRQ